MSGRSIPRVALAAVLAFLGHVVVEPVREGRLRDVDWPLGLRPVVLVGLVGYALAALLVLGSGLLREWVPLDTQSGSVELTLPRSIVWVVLALTAFSMTLAVSGALHAPAWFRWLTVVVVGLVLVATSTPDQTTPIARTVSIACAVGLVLFVALRGHRRFAWWEFAVLTVLVWAPLVTTAAVLTSVNRQLGFDFLPLLVSLMLSMLGQLAIPAALAAGAAVASFAVSSALWSAKVVRDTIGPRAVWAALALVAVWRTVDVVLGLPGVLQDDGWRRVAGSVLLLVAMALAWVVLARVRPGRGVPLASVMIDRIDVVALGVAALSTSSLLAVIGHLVAQVALGFDAAPEAIAVIGVVSDLLASSTVLYTVRGLGGVGLLVLAVVQARRGRRTMPELYAALGVGTVIIAAVDLFGFPLFWSEDGLALVGSVAALLLLAVMLVRRAVTPARGTSLLVALLMAALFAYREVVTDPIAFLLGFAGAAVVLFGFVWAFLTGYEVANGDSPKYPRSARVQLVLANALFGITVLAFISLARNPDAAVSLADLAAYGGQAFGDPLVTAGLLLALWAALRGREVDADADAADASADRALAGDHGVGGDDLGGGELVVIDAGGDARDGVAGDERRVERDGAE